MTGGGWRDPEAAEGPSRAPHDRLPVREAGRVWFLSAAEIEWVAAARNRVRCHAAGRSYALSEPISAVERRLDPRRFLRVHRSAIVNLARVEALERTAAGRYVLTLTSGQRLAVARSHLRALSARLGLGGHRRGAVELGRPAAGAQGVDGQGSGWYETNAERGG